MPTGEIPGECPLPDELGRSGWNVLHSAAAVYPYNPSPAQQEAFRAFLHGWSQVYACSYCAYHMRRHLMRNPPVVRDKLALNRYLCEFHNAVNKNVGKPVYDCDPMNVLRRWHPTFPDMEDEPTIEEQLATQQQQQQHRRAENAAVEKRTGGLWQSPTHVFSQSDDYSKKRSSWRLRTGDGMNSDSNGNGVAVGALAAGWGSPAHQGIHGEKKEKMGLHESGVQQATEQRPKRWSLFGGSGAPSTAPTSSGIQSNLETAGGNGNTNNDGVSDDDDNVQSILKRLKACMIYCPENDKKKTSA